MLGWWVPRRFRTVIVNLKSDRDVAYRGVLWQRRGAWLFLRNVELLRATTEPAPFDGELMVHRDNIAFFQVLGG